MNLQNKYSRDEFLSFISSFIPNFSKDIRKVDTRGLKTTTDAVYLGESPDLDLAVFELTHTSSSDARVMLATEGFKLMKDSSNFRALIAYVPEKSNDWRLSLMTATPDTTEKGKVILKLSNPRRYSFFLGESAKVNTPYQFLIKQEDVKDFNELQKRFSLEVVNKDFYKEISQAFVQLVNGQLKLPFVNEKSQTHLEFAVRLIGRIIFCWFLREKKSETGLPLMPQQILSLDAVHQNGDYYHSILEPIFFEVLNKPIKLRREDFAKEPFSSAPYLNGGLFSPQEDDYYKRSNGDLQSQFHNTLVIPDKWFKDFFETLETYNFTIDENTSFDEELSIDPEMLGRIFENLLAEINPETGESARKATGSYYTPRSIVNYMVDESLLLYLMQKTGIDENKLRAIISYDLTDDSEHSIVQDEKERIIDALETLKLLDPACGSGAFPIGALQKIVFVLQQVDPEGHLWFKKQLLRTSPELRRVIQREFENQNFDYIRKLGIIRENIYGVDIQPIATDISRLRCFLTLIVDESVDDSLENRGIDPLPNLDFKFVTANSLRGLPSSKAVNQMGLFEDDRGIRGLKELRDSFFNATGVEREQLKLQFVQAQNKMFQRMIEGGTKGYADLTTRLSGWDPFSHKASSWFEPEWMFGIKDGFDIVIANPPWGADLNKEEKQKLKELYPEIDSSTPNSFAYFIGLALSLRNNILSYVLPDSVLIKDFSKTRKLLTPHLTEISWYQNTSLPENLRPFVYVEHDVCVIFATKQTAQLMKTILNRYSSHEGVIVPKVSVVEKNKVILEEFDYVYNLAVNDDDLKILEKIRKLEPLNSRLQCHEGIHSGNIRNKLFKKESLGNKYKPLYFGAGTGGDKINNYFSSRNGWFVDYRKEIVDEDNGEYASLRDERIFKFPKIYITRTGNPFKAFIDESNYASNNFFSLQFKNYEVNKLEELMAILPFIVSKLSQYFIRRFAAPRLGNTFVETKILHLLKMRIPKLSSDEKKELIKMVEKAIQHAQNENYSELNALQDHINNTIYKFYGLTKSEIEIVENSN